MAERQAPPSPRPAPPRPPLPGGARRGAAAVALAALGYPVCRALAQALASGLLSAWGGVPGASLAHPVGVGQTGAVLLWAAAQGLALAASGVWVVRAAGLRRARLRLNRPARRFWGILPLFLGLVRLADLAAGLLERALGLTGGQQLLPASGTALAASFFALCVLPALGEELLFRGAMQAALRPFGPGAAVWGAALLFALEHGSPRQCLTALAAGLILGWYAEWCGSVWPGVGLHLCNNAMAFWTGWLNQYRGEDAALLLVGAGLLLGVFGLGLALRLPRPAGDCPAARRVRRQGLRALLAEPAYRLALAGLALALAWKGLR